MRARFTFVTIFILLFPVSIKAQTHLLQLSPENKGKMTVTSIILREGCIDPENLVPII